MASVYEAPYQVLVQVEPAAYLYEAPYQVLVQVTPPSGGSGGQGDDLQGLQATQGRGRLLKGVLQGNGTKL